MFEPRKECTNCERQATVEVQGRFYCSEHALDKLRARQDVPPMKLLQR